VYLFRSYRDFNKNEYQYHVLDTFNWEDGARTVLHKYEQKAASCIDRQSEFAFEMTNGFYGHQ